MVTVPSVETEVGMRVRALRQAAGMTLADLATATRISSAQLSRLETGERAWSLGALVNLAGTLGVPVTALLPTEESDPEPVVHSTGPVMRAADLAVRSLTNRSGSRLQPFRVSVPSDRSWHPDAAHRGEEWIFVLGGVVTVHHGVEAHTLAEGDALHFDASEPHRIMSKLGAELIIVMDSGGSNGDK